MTAILRIYGERFRQHWERFLERFRITSNLRQNVYNELLRQYGNRRRHYHGIQHPVFLLEELEIARTNVPEWFSDPSHDLAIELALWDHDLFYNTRRLDNEELSAERVMDHAHDLGLSPVVGVEAAQLILATKHRERPADLAAQIVTDIDLSPLAAPWETFKQNTLEIREEYAHISDADFKRGRREFIESMTRRSSIYTTNYFFTKFEARAQENLRRSYRESFAH